MVSDADEDGLSDADEVVLGTNPTSADTDNDQTGDGDEVRVFSTNPLDSGSAPHHLGTRFCSDWNSFLPGMWNILELVNVSGQAVRASIVLYDITGRSRQTAYRVVQPGQQSDVLVHDFRNRAAQSYGQVCVSHDGGDGALDGRMAHYLGSAEGIGSSRWFQFGFAMPFSAGHRGVQFVPFNTYQPSHRTVDASDPVANWIQLTNLSEATGVGTLLYYAASGRLLASERITLHAAERRDFSAHRFGVGIVGMVSWMPDRNDLDYSLRNVRYAYDNARLQNSFDTAFQLEATPGTLGKTWANYSTNAETSVLELGNAMSSPMQTKLAVYRADGSLVREVIIALNGFATRHIILDGIAGLNARGTVSVEPLDGGRVVSTVMQYGRTSEGGIRYMYGIPTVEAIGEVVQGSYNTYLQQRGELHLVNTSDTAETVYYNLTRSDGAPVLRAASIVIPARGTKIVNINSLEGSDQYGVITVETQRPHVLIASVLRRRGSDYVMPTPLR